MSTPSPGALPVGYTFGRVVARFLRAVGDSGDVDTFPEAVPATGSVTFTPKVTTRIVVDSTSDPSPFITHEPITSELDAYGHLARNGLRGLWLWTGVWTVSFNVQGFNRQPFDIEITTSHTDVSPFDLWEADPYIPPPGTTVTTIQVPANPVDGYGLVWSSASGGLIWGKTSESTVSITDAEILTALEGV